MKTLRTRLALSLTALAALFATPAAAAQVEGAVVPPSNSAATQYTETFPTTGGDKKTDQKPVHRSPAKVLGSHNAQKLAKQGPEGQAAAETAAATAPASIATPPPPPVHTHPTHSTPSKGAGNQGGGGGQGKGNGGEPRSGVEGGSGTAPQPASEPAGSSGIGAALGQALGLSSTGGSGPLLPLVILATVLWALAYFRRQRQQVG